MATVGFNAKVKSAVTKKDGVKVLVLEVIDGSLRGKLDLLDTMVDYNVEVNLDSLTIAYRVQVNAKTNKPVTEYKVDESGVVSEVKPDGEQLEAELGLPKDKAQIKEEHGEADRMMIDEFILSGLAPIYEDMTFDFPHILTRFIDGVTYAKIASELKLSLGEFSVILDEYRKRVAPLAMKWHEWKEGKLQAPADEANADNADNPDTAGQGSAETEHGLSETDPKSGQTGQQPGEIDDSWMLDGGLEGNRQSDLKPGQTGEQPAGTEPAIEDIEGFILDKAPTFEDIPFDFPALLKRKKAGESWMEIAQSLNVPSTKLSSVWSKYKQKVKEKMNDNGAA